MGLRFVPGILALMELFEALYTRRSIRKYQDRPVPSAIVEKLLGSAMMAPSAGDARPWHFVVIEGSSAVAETIKALPHAEMVKSAPLAILVCADPILEKFPGCWMLDCSAATENMLLAAHGLGLGAVWVAVWPYEDFVKGARAHFGIPEGIEPLAMVVAGYPAETVPSDDRYDATRVHMGKW